MSVISKELFKRIQKIHITTAHLVDTFLAGAYRSAFKGKGMEFEEVREYSPGDEIRSIDWNVTARMRNPYVKVFREERELIVNLMVDVSASARFGSTNRRKSDLMAEVGAVLAFSAIKNQDKVGLILFSDRVEKYIPPKKGLRHVLRVIRELLIFQPTCKGTDIGAALSFLGKVQRRSAVCFLLSDFLTSRDPLQAIKVAAKKHDLVAIDVVDPYEKRFPSLHLIQLKDLETGELAIVDSSHAEVQDAFSKAALKRQKQWKSLMEKVGSDYFEIATDKPYSTAIQKYFKGRRKR